MTPYDYFMFCVVVPLIAFNTAVIVGAGLTVGVYITTKWFD